jgi:hypothetical protein
MFKGLNKKLGTSVIHDGYASIELSIRERSVNGTSTTSLMQQRDSKNVRMWVKLIENGEKIHIEI